MATKEKLYNAFGELIYAIARADGAVQDVEEEALIKVLNNHPWSKEIKWSFDYEACKENCVSDAYDKAMNIFKEHGPDPEYKFMLEVMTEVAEAFHGIVPEEKELIDRFKRDLKQKFLKDIEDKGMYF